jgi:hypothetical protein
MFNNSFREDFPQYMLNIKIHVSLQEVLNLRNYFFYMHLLQYITTDVLVTTYSHNTSLMYDAFKELAILSEELQQML